MKRLLSFLALALAALPALSLCESELSQIESQNLPSDQLQRNRDWYKGFNGRDDQYVTQTVARLHLEPSPFNTGDLRYEDRGAVSACILRHLSDVRFKDISSYAQEGYALRLLKGHGVVQDQPLAMKYLERAAKQGYASAGVRLAQLQLQGNPTPEMLRSGVSWAIKALKDAGTTPGGSVNPQDAVPLLKKAVGLMVARRNIDEAKEVYRMVESLNFKSRPQEFIAQGHPQIREGSSTERLEKYANSPEAARLSEWYQCYENRTQQRWQTMDFEGFRDNFRTSLFKVGVESSCGKYPG